MPSRLACPASCELCGIPGVAAALAEFRLRSSRGSKAAWLCSRCASTLTRSHELSDSERRGIPEAVLAALSRLYDTSLVRAGGANRNRFIGHTLALADIVRLWKRQGGKCALTGRTLRCDLLGTDAPEMPSLDRIDSRKGYHAGNVHLVCWAVNLMKSDMSLEDFGDWCTAVVLHGLRAKEDAAA